MALKFYIQVKGKVSGPLSGSDLMSLAQSGKLLPTNMVRQDGSDKRVQAHRIRNLNFGTPQEESEEEIEEILEVEPVRQTTAPRDNNQPAQRRCFNSATTFQPWKQLLEKLTSGVFTAGLQFGHDLSAVETLTTPFMT